MDIIKKEIHPSLVKYLENELDNKIEGADLKNLGTLDKLVNALYAIPKNLHEITPEGIKKYKPEHLAQLFWLQTHSKTITNMQGLRNPKPEEVAVNTLKNLEVMLQLVEAAKPIINTLIQQHKKKQRIKEIEKTNKDSINNKSNKELEKFIEKMVVDFYNQTQAAKYFDVSRQTVSNWIKEGKIKTIKHGTRPVITKNEMIRFYKEYILGI
jgi:excisionase family DNA binding protein